MTPRPSAATRTPAAAPRAPTPAPSGSAPSIAPRAPAALSASPTLAPAAPAPAAPTRAIGMGWARVLLAIWLTGAAVLVAAAADRDGDGRVAGPPRRARGRGGVDRAGRPAGAHLRPPRGAPDPQPVDRDADDLGRAAPHRAPPRGRRPVDARAPRGGADPRAGARGAQGRAHPGAGAGGRCAALVQPARLDRPARGARRGREVLRRLGAARRHARLGLRGAPAGDGARGGPRPRARRAGPAHGAALHLRGAAAGHPGARRGARPGAPRAGRRHRGGHPRPRGGPGRHGPRAAASRARVGRHRR